MTNSEMVHTCLLVCEQLTVCVPILNVIPQINLTWEKGRKHLTLCVTSWRQHENQGRVTRSVLATSNGLRTTLGTYNWISSDIVMTHDRYTKAHR